MNDLDAMGMQHVTAYAPARIITLGLLRLIFGLLLGAAAFAVLYSTPDFLNAPRQPGDLPGWWMVVVGLVLAFVAFCIVSGGVGRIVSAFAGDCYFKAGPEGIAIRMPRQKWFGRFKLVEYRFKWDEIRQLVHFTNKINLIPISRELRIEPVTGKTISIARYYFSTSVKNIQRQLLAIQTMAR